MENPQAGLKQRVRALNMFIHDVYHEQAIIKAGVVPPGGIYSGQQPVPAEMRGLNVPNDVYAHVAGVDVVRAGKATAAATTMCWKTICACPPASAICWKTAR